MNNRKLILALSCLLLAIPCQARVITVDDDGPADFNNIQAAIDDANDGDVIEVQPGTYTGVGNRDIDFLGKVITVRSVDPNDRNAVAATIIDCNGSESDPHRGFYFHSEEGPNSVLSGVSIINGYSCIQDASLGKGCIDCDPCSVTPGIWDANGTPEDPSDDFWVDGDCHLR